MAVPSVQGRRGGGARPRSRRSAAAGPPARAAALGAALEQGTEDAEDALQRALEIYVRRVSAVAPATELAWLAVVLRHEACPCARRAAGTPLEARELGVTPAGRRRRRRGADRARQSAPRGARGARAAQAGRAHGPAAEGGGATRTRDSAPAEVDLHEGQPVDNGGPEAVPGRRRIESGEECGRHAPALVQLAEGAGAAADVVALRPHLRHCTACRAARARAGHRTTHGCTGWRCTSRSWPASCRALASFPDRAARRELGEHTERATDLARGARGFIHQLFARLHGSDVVTGTQLASGGGGQGTAVAAIVGLCLGAGGAGTYCLSTGTLPARAGCSGNSPSHRRGRRTRRSGARGRSGASRRRPPTTTVATAAREPKRPLPTATPAPSGAPRRRAASRRVGGGMRLRRRRASRSSASSLSRRRPRRRSANRRLWPVPPRPAPRRPCVLRWRRQ